MDVKGIVAVVTGGASGLGEATCRKLLAEGAKGVAILDLQEERGRALESELGDSSLFCQTDITNADSVDGAMEKACKKFGAIHVAVNSAGIGTPAKVISKGNPISMDRFNQVIQVNLIGTMHAVRSSALRMLNNTPNPDGERGVIINVSSGAAFEGQIGQAAYSASKAAIVGMTFPIAREFADYGIRVMTIAPGMFETPIFSGMESVKEAIKPSLLFPKRMGLPIEFAMLVSHIIENPMMNARTIRLDGGVILPAKV
jgi:3-hydroxyacyl-CoA dehydrogenase / 3-hydroxy-2-methylbutyryl-CoA dehydrogenase